MRGLRDSPNRRAPVLKNLRHWWLEARPNDAPPRRRSRRRECRPGRGLRELVAPRWRVRGWTATSPAGTREYALMQQQFFAVVPVPICLPKLEHAPRRQLGLFFAHGRKTIPALLFEDGPHALPVLEPLLHLGALFGSQPPVACFCQSVRVGSHRRFSTKCTTGR